MKLIKNLSKLQVAIFSLLVVCTGVLGYLFYDSYRTNIQNRELIADTKIENKDLSQDLDIIKDKHERLQKEVEQLKTKVKSVSYKKKYHKKKRLYAAGRSSKNKHSYKKGRVSYKQLYYQLKRQCGKMSYTKKNSYKKNSYKKNNYKKSSYSRNNYKSNNYSPYVSREYKRR